MDPGPIIAALVTALVGTWGTFITAFFRGDLIPGHVYRREVKRGETATTQNVRTADSLALLAKAHEEERRDYLNELARLRTENARLQLQIGDLKRQGAHSAPSG